AGLLHLAERAGRQVGQRRADRLVEHRRRRLELAAHQAVRPAAERRDADRAAAAAALARQAEQGGRQAGAGARAVLGAADRVAELGLRARETLRASAGVARAAAQLVDEAVAPLLQRDAGV